VSSEQPREARFFENRPEGQSAVVTRLRWNLDLMQIEKLVNGVYAKVSQEEDDYWTEKILFGGWNIEEVSEDEAASWLV